MAAKKQLRHFLAVGYDSSCGWISGGIHSDAKSAQQDIYDNFGGEIRNIKIIEIEGLSAPKETNPEIFVVYVE